MMPERDGHRIAVILPDHSMILAPKDRKGPLFNSFLHNLIKPVPFPWASISFHEKHCIILRFHALQLSNGADKVFIGTVDPLEENRSWKLQESYDCMSAWVLVIHASMKAV